jgi:hypothetical protein
MSVGLEFSITISAVHLQPVKKEEERNPAYHPYERPDRQYNSYDDRDRGGDHGYGKYRVIYSGSK